MVLWDEAIECAGLSDLRRGCLELIVKGDLVQEDVGVLEAPVEASLHPLHRPHYAIQILQ